MHSHIIIHNQISLDGALTGFQLNMKKHYELVDLFKPDAMLVGSRTVIAGFVMFNMEIPAETKTDMKKPSGSENTEKPFWIIPDSTARLVNKLHAIRNSGYCRDVIVLISEKTLDAYMDYLMERYHEMIETGLGKVDLRKAFEILSDRHTFQTIVTDAGGILAGHLIKEKLADELSLLIVPAIAGTNPPSLFNPIDQFVKLRLRSYREFKDGLIWLRYRIIYT